ncbi:MAG: hypothetical protein WCI88_14770 [Chloroflexota bacterium]
MNSYQNNSTITMRYRNAFAIIAFSTLLILILACNMPFDTGSSDQSVVQTQTALNVQMTMLAVKQNQVEGSGGGNNDQSQQETQIAQSVQATSLAADVARATDDAVAASLQPSPIPPTQAQAGQQAASDQGGGVTQGGGNPPQGGSGGMPDFDAWTKNATILLYEDMAGQPLGGRYIQSAMETMGLKATIDDKDAGGNFLRDLKGGSPSGAWDLIISASEARTAIQGEFIPALNDNVSNGSSLIMEHWNIDGIANGRIATLLAGCGVAFEANIQSSPKDCGLPKDENFLILWPLEQGNPLLTTPNSGLRLSSMSQYWSKYYSLNCHLGNWSGPYDYGDMLALVPGSKAKLVLGTSSTANDRHGVLATCHEGRMTLWTSSTHNYDFNRVLPLWVNMLQNALKARYEYLSRK